MALLALLVTVPALITVLVLAMAVRSYERLYRLVQALLVGLISEVDLPGAGAKLIREVAGGELVKPHRQGEHLGEFPDG